MLAISSPFPHLGRLNVAKPGPSDLLFMLYYGYRHKFRAKLLI
jgi:hypothetical protein